jgi:hypothetical protein
MKMEYMMSMSLTCLFGRDSKSQINRLFIDRNDLTICSKFHLLKYKKKKNFLVMQNKLEEEDVELMAAAVARKLWFLGGIL